MILKNKNSLSSAFWIILSTDIAVSIRRPGGVFHPILFFIITVSLFPIAVSPDPEFLQKLAPGIIWVAALLATLLALDGIFRSEYDGGSLELLVLSPHPLTVLVMARVCAHWMVSGLPLILISALLGLMLNLPACAFAAMLVGLLLGTPAMSMIGAIGAALTVGLRKSGVLLTLIIMPLYVPILIFGTRSIQSAGAQLNWIGPLYLLGAMLILCLTLAPFAIAAALKISLN